jgi:hypothetical protein
MRVAGRNRLPWSCRGLSKRIHRWLTAMSSQRSRPSIASRGLNGSNWLIDGRGEDIIAGVNRWSRRGLLYDLGRLFFELAGSPQPVTSAAYVASECARDGCSWMLRGT